jgi:hypothetical protein
MKIEAVDVEVAVSQWDSEQNVNLYDSFTGEYHSSGTVRSIDPNSVDYDLVEAVDENGQPVNPKLKR